MKKYLVCSLNDENYTQADYDFCNTLDEAKEQCIQNVVECCEVTKEEAISHMEFNVNGITENEFEKYIEWRWRYDYKDEDIFFVNQIIEIDVDENDYLCIWHHAYNGVDFIVLEIGTEEKCEIIMNANVAKTLDDNKYADVDFANDSQIVIDTSEEWEVWDIVKYKEDSKKIYINSNKLAERIFNTLSDGYDDEEVKDETVTALYNELSQISNDSYIKAAFVQLCERIEELES